MQLAWVTRKELSEIVDAVKLENRNSEIDVVGGTPPM
jgi:hypothetical protein